MCYDMLSGQSGVLLYHTSKFMLVCQARMPACPRCLTHALFNEVYRAASDPYGRTLLIPYPIPLPNLSIPNHCDPRHKRFQFDCTFRSSLSDHSLAKTPGPHSFLAKLPLHLADIYTFIYFFGPSSPSAFTDKNVR